MAKKKMTDAQLFGLLEDWAHPPGHDEPRVCSIELGTQKYYNGAFILECVDELKRLKVRGMAGEPPNALERLAFSILKTAAGRLRLE